MSIGSATPKKVDARLEQGVSSGSVVRSGAGSVSESVSERATGSVSESISELLSEPVSSSVSVSKSADASSKELKVDWSSYHQLIERLVILVHQSGESFDQILCLARGGLRVGDVFSRIFDLPLAILATSSYRDDAGHTQGALNIAPFITTTQGTLSGRILVVDDMVDSGQTLDLVCKHLLYTYPGIASLKTAVLWYKIDSVIEPDYFVEKLSGNLWIDQPFELYDGLSASELAQKHKNALAS